MNNKVNKKKMVTCPQCEGTGRKHMKICEECRGAGGYQIETCLNCNHGTVKIKKWGYDEYTSCPDCSGTGWLHPWMKRRLQNMKEVHEESFEIQRQERIDYLKQRIKSAEKEIKHLELDEYIVKTPWCESDDGKVHGKYNALRDNLEMRKQFARNVIKLKKELEELQAIA